MSVLHFFKRYTVYAKTMWTDTLENTACVWWSGHLIDSKKMVRNCEVCSKSFLKGVHFSVTLSMGTYGEISTNILSLEARKITEVLFPQRPCPQRKIRGLCKRKQFISNA